MFLQSADHPGHLQMRYERFAGTVCKHRCLQGPITRPNRAPRLRAVQFFPLDIFYGIKPKTWPALCIWFLNQDPLWKSSTGKKKKKYNLLKCSPAA